MKKDLFYALHYSNLNTPPPFLYELTVNFTIDQEKVDICYEKHYVDRAQCTIEELEEEGFTDNDDSSIEASLNSAWIPYFEHLVQKQSWVSKLEEQTLYSNNVVRLSSTGHEDLYQEIDGIEYELEELLQALVETLDIEAPLSIFMRRNESGSLLDTELYWSFKNRAFEARHKQNTQSYTWEEGRELLSLFYGTDLSEQQVFKKNIPEGCTCINPGDGLWYKTPQHSLWKEIIHKFLPA
jgi:hypothetical protein